MKDKPNKSNESTGLVKVGLVKVLNEKCARQEKMFDVYVEIFLCGLNYFV